jgi:hypothetical protein
MDMPYPSEQKNDSSSTKERPLSTTLFRSNFGYAIIS